MLGGCFRLVDVLGLDGLDPNRDPQVENGPNPRKPPQHDEQKRSQTILRGDLV